jgi:hypothetical protein
VSPVLLQAALPPLTAACAVWSALRGGPARTPPALAVCLGVPLALGVAGMGELVSLLLGGGTSTSVMVHLGLLACAAALAWRRRAMAPAPSRLRAVSGSWLGPATGLAFGAAALAAGLAAIAVLRALPHGVWDVWAVWNNRARFLYRGGAEWTGIFHGEVQHPDYPLLLALLNSALWRVVGTDSTVVPRTLAFTYTALSVAMVVAVTRYLHGHTQGWLAGLAVLALPHFVAQGAQQGADVPLGFFALAALACVALAEAEHGERDGPLVLAGVFSGLAAWTKNEGLLFALALIVALGLVRGARRAHPWPALRALLRGFTPLALLLWAIRLMFVRTPAGVVEPDATLLLLGKRLFEADRHAVILAGSWRFLSGEWPPAQAQPPLLVLALLAAYVVAAGLRQRGGVGGAPAVLLATLVLVAAGYYAVYLVTRYDLHWFVTSSVDRLFVQFWPSLVLAVFLWALSPEEVGLAPRPPANEPAPGAPEARLKDASGGPSLAQVSP